MNITDILDGMKKDASETLVTKLQIRTESHKIDQRSEDFANNVINWLADEIKYINNGLAYGYDPRRQVLSDEDKKILLDKVKETALSIPGKIEKQLKEIYSDSSDEKKEDEKEEPEQEVKQVEVEIQPAVSATQAPTFSNFGY